MKILIDTHVFLWVLSDDEHLTKEARSYVENPDNEVYISIVSFWEISIKHKLKPQAMPLSGKQAIDYAKDSGIKTLAINHYHIEGLDELENYHSDPFDRMIISQAIKEPMRIITHDSIFKNYVNTLTILI